MHDLVWRNTRFLPHDIEFQNNWNRLATQMGTSVLSMDYTWYQSCAEACEHFSIETNVLEIKDRNTDKIIGLIPYIIRHESIYRFFQVKAAYLMRHNQEYGDHYDLLITPDYYSSATCVLAQWMRENDIDVCFLKNMHPNTKFSSLLSLSPKFPLLATISERIANSIIWLPTQSKYKEWSAGKFKRIMQYKRKLEKSFQVSYCNIESKCEIPEILSQYKIMHSTRFSNKGTTSSLCADPQQFHFLERLVQNAFDRGILMGNYIKLDGKLASVEISFLINGNLFAYTSAFDEIYSKYRIGSIQTLMMLEKSISLGVDVIDLLQGDEAYKQHWSQSRNFDFDLALFKKKKFGYFLFLVTIFRRPLEILYHAGGWFKELLPRFSCFVMSRKMRI